MVNWSGKLTYNGKEYQWKGISSYLKVLFQSYLDAHPGATYNDVMHDLPESNFTYKYCKSFTGPFTTIATTYILFDGTLITSPSVYKKTYSIIIEGKEYWLNTNLGEKDVVKFEKNFDDKKYKFDRYYKGDITKNCAGVLTNLGKAGMKPTTSIPSTKMPSYTVAILLECNKQLILNGAPGTGKTYSAIGEIADQLLFGTGTVDPDKKKIQVEMIQFHPSYDYTDFIEGIRPDLSGSSVTYSLKNGSFKSFCIKAGVIERIIAAKKTLDKKNIIDFLHYNPSSLSEIEKSVVDFWTDFITIVSKSEVDNYNNSLTSSSNPPYDCTELINNLPQFLFVIDEINRAEISKVFGETMFCLDKDYRGAAGCIKTQYASSSTPKTFYVNPSDDRFFIPTNVYIIGTMNDIDRSVEVFDFALRRRFAWYEVEAEAVMDDVLKSMGIDSLLKKNYSNYLDKIIKLNTAIFDELHFSRHYKLGPAYFAKIANYYDSTAPNYIDAKTAVWDNHISQILNEYIKGKRNLENELKQMHDDFIS